MRISNSVLEHSVVVTNSFPLRSRFGSSRSPSTSCKYYLLFDQTIEIDWGWETHASRRITAHAAEATPAKKSNAPIVSRREKREKRQHHNPTALAKMPPATSSRRFWPKSPKKIQTRNDAHIDPAAHSAMTGRAQMMERAEESQDEETEPLRRLVDFRGIRLG